MLEKFINALLSNLDIIIGWALGLLSGLLLAEYNFKKTKELEKKKNLQAKIEELAKLIYKIKQECTRIWTETRTNRVTITKNGVSTEINLKNIEDALKSIKDVVPLLYLLINFYFPELKSEYNKLSNKKENVNKLLVPFYLREDEERCREAAEKMNDTVKNIETICDNITSSSTTIAQRLL